MFFLLHWLLHPIAWGHCSVSCFFGGSGQALSAGRKRGAPGASDALREQRKLQELAGSEQVGTAHITSLMQLPEEDVELTCFSESLLMTFTKYL